MVQSINSPGIRSFLANLFDSKLYVPKLWVPNIKHINFMELRREFDAVIFDKDNCLTRPYKADLEFSLDSAKSFFEKDRLAVISNCIGCEDEQGAVNFEREHKIKVIRHNVKKPDCIQSVDEHFPLIPRRKICLVGDRLSTDIVMANKHGLFSILVDPITEEGDNPFAVILRRLERFWLNRFAKYKTKEEYKKYLIYCCCS